MPPRSYQRLLMDCHMMHEFRWILRHARFVRRKPRSFQIYYAATTSSCLARYTQNAEGDMPRERSHASRLFSLGRQRQQHSPGPGARHCCKNESAACQQQQQCSEVSTPTCVYDGPPMRATRARSCRFLEISRPAAMHRDDAII